MRILCFIAVLTTMATAVLLCPRVAAGQDDGPAPSAMSEMTEAVGEPVPPLGRANVRQPTSHVQARPLMQTTSPTPQASFAAILLIVAVVLALAIQAAITIFVVWCLWRIKVHTQQTAQQLAALSERVTPSE